MTTPGQAPVASVAEAAERSHFALRRAVVDVAMGLLHAGVLSHSGHADLSAGVGPASIPAQLALIVLRTQAGLLFIG